MASKFQKQLVGSIILVGISVAVLPSLFDGKKWYNDENQPAIQLYQQNSQPHPVNQAAMPSNQDVEALTQIPEQFSVPNDGQPQEPINTDQQPLLDNEIAHTQPAQTEQNSNVAPQPKQINTNQPAQSTTQATPSVAGKYAIQLAALSDEVRAKELANQLNQAGYGAFTVKGKKLTRVYIGPNDSKKTLEQQLPQLKSLTGLDGQIVTIQ